MKRKDKDTVSVEKNREKDEDVEIITEAEDTEAAGNVQEEETVEPSTEELIKEIDEANEKYLRLYADFENYRKRVVKEKEDLVKYASETVISELLPILDNFELALSHVQNDTNNPLIQGVQMTHKEMKKVLGKLALVEIESKDKPFDPQYHHAMSQVETEDLEDNTVIEEFRKGYMYKDKVLRPAMVSVSKKAEKISDKEVTDSQENDINLDTKKEDKNNV